MLMSETRINTWFWVSVSVGLHALLAAVLLFGAPGAGVFSQKPDSFHFTWVMLPGAHSPAVHKAAPSGERPAAKGLSEASVPVSDRPEIERSVQPPNQMLAASSDNRIEISRAAYTPAGFDDEPVSSYAARDASTEGEGEPSGMGRGGAAITRALPLYRENPPPGYPAIARLRGYQGVVLVEAEILPDGQVGQVNLRKSSGYAILDRAALSAVKSWKFEPARKSGIPYTTRAELPIKFVLNDSSLSS